MNALPRYGARARLGMLLPSGNTVAEPVFAALLPPGVSLHTTRLKLVDATAEALVAMADRVEDAAGLVADAGVDLVAFHCTAVSTWDAALEASIRERIAAATGRPVTSTAEALLAALAALGARRVVLVSPYTDAVNAREVDFLAARGVQVLSAWGAGLIGAGEMAAVAPETWRDAVLARRDDAADAYIIACTTIRSVEAIEPLEAALGRPVLTSNQAMLWHALRRCGIDDRLPGLGRLCLEH
jgi:maleate isomerase